MTTEAEKLRERVGEAVMERLASEMMGDLDAYSVGIVRVDCPKEGGALNIEFIPAKDIYK